MNSHKSTYQKIEFCALGQHHVAYCETHLHYNSIETVVKMICPTAEIEAVSTDLVDQLTFEEKHLSNIIAWKSKVDELEDGITVNSDESHLPNHFTRCDNARCNLKRDCKRFTSNAFDVLYDVVPRPDVRTYLPLELTFEHKCGFQIPRANGRL